MNEHEPRIPRSLAPCALWMLLATAGVVAGFPRAAAACIASPEEYHEAWKSFRTDCVAPTLLGTLHVRHHDSLYPMGQKGAGIFWYAWAGSHDNLEMFLRLNETYGDPKKTGYAPNKVRAGIMTIMGFAQIPGGAFNLAVYTLPGDEEVLVPSLATWMYLLERDLGLVYPLPAQKALAQAYSRLAPDENVVEVYAKLSGCPYEVLIRAKHGPGPYPECDPEYNQAVKVSVCSAYGRRPDGKPCESRQCFRNFFENYKGPRDAAAIRGAIAQCQDASQWNTGMGIGFSTLPNPFVCKPAREQTVAERYTGREFILLNRRLEDLREYVDIELYYDPEGGDRFLVDGYCGAS